MAVDQLVGLLAGAIGAQAPGVDQVTVDVDFLGDAVEAVGQGAEQAALNHGFRGFSAVSALSVPGMRLAASSCVLSRQPSSRVSNRVTGHSLSRE